MQEHGIPTVEPSVFEKAAATKGEGGSGTLSDCLLGNDKWPNRPNRLRGGSRNAVPCAHLAKDDAQCWKSPAKDSRVGGEPGMGVHSLPIVMPTATLPADPSSFSWSYLEAVCPASPALAAFLNLLAEHRVLTASWLCPTWRIRAGASCELLLQRGCHLQIWQLFLGPWMGQRRKSNGPR